MLLGINDLPITSLPFTPFPVPSDIPIPGTFPETQPQHPPPVSDSGKVVPDFGGAWKAEHDKAKTRITGWSLEDKVAAVTGVGWEAGLCIGNIPRIRDFGGICLQVFPHLFASVLFYLSLAVFFRMAPWVFVMLTS